MDYVYRRFADNAACSCLYAVETDMGLQPSCIIGHWAHQDLGVPLQAFRVVEGRGASDVLAQLGVLRYEHATTRTMSTVQRIARHVQIQQDQGVGWVAAVKTTERWVRAEYP